MLPGLCLRHQRTTVSWNLLWQDVVCGRAKKSQYDAFISSLSGVPCRFSYVRFIQFRQRTDGKPCPTQRCAHWGSSDRRQQDSPAGWRFWGSRSGAASGSRRNHSASGYRSSAAAGDARPNSNWTCDSHPTAANHSNTAFAHSNNTPRSGSCSRNHPHPTSRGSRPGNTSHSHPTADSGYTCPNHRRTRTPRTGI
jgi:hypothetical protein